MKDDILENIEKLLVNNTLEISKTIERLEREKKEILKQLDNKHLNDETVGNLKRDLEEIDGLVEELRFNIETDDEIVGESNE